MIHLIIILSNNELFIVISICYCLPNPCIIKNVRNHNYLTYLIGASCFNYFLNRQFVLLWPNEWQVLKNYFHVDHEVYVEIAETKSSGSHFAISHPGNL